MEQFWKLARPDGFDFYTGKTINYRDGIGKEVTCPKYDRNGSLCSDAFLHASREINQCFIGAKIPCSVYRVEGTPIREDSEKCGFGSLTILEEIAPEKAFDWNYAEACNPINPFEIDPPAIMPIEILKQWASVRASVRASVWASVWASVGASVGASVRAYIGSLFHLKRNQWLYTESITTDGYPFQPAVDLWKMGLVASFNGTLWRLHGKPNGKILWEGNA